MSPTPFQLVVLAVLAGFGALRIYELWVARRFATRAESERGEEPKREPAFIAMVALHTGPFWAIPLEVFLLERPLVGWLTGASAGMLVLALGLRFWTLRTLGAMWNVRIVKPGHVVTDGPYRFLRHPNYLVVILELLFLPLFAGAWWSAIGLTLGNALVLAMRIPAEERVLDSVPGYREAMGHKPRFLPLPFR